MSIRTNYLLLILSFAALAVFAPSIEAQTPLNDGYILLQLQNESISFYYAEDIDQPHPLLTLPDITLRGMPPILDESIEYIRHPSDITLSPNGQFIAFTTYSHYMPSERASLYLYSLKDSALHRIDIPGLALPLWSPDSSAVLLVPPPYYGQDTYDMQVHDAYLYTISSDRVIRITHTTTEGYKNSFYWLPDNEHIIYSKGGRDFYVTDRQGQHETRFTNAISLHLPTYNYVICRTRSPQWSAAHQRLYFVAGCSSEGEDDGHDSLHSISLTGGDERLELDLHALYPDDYYGTEISNFYLDPVGTGIYIVVRAQTQYFAGSGIDYQAYDEVVWRVGYLNEAGDWRLIAEKSTPDLTSSMAFAAALSPSGKYLAVAGNLMQPEQGLLSVVNTQTGQLLDVESAKSICAVRWLNDQELLYTEFNGHCGTSIPEPYKLQMLDIKTSHTADVFTNLSGMVWMLPFKHGFN